MANRRETALRLAQLLRDAGEEGISLTDTEFLNDLIRFFCTTITITPYSENDSPSERNS